MRAFWFLPLLFACASSPLVRPDDREFARAEARLAATSVDIARDAGSPAEAALLAQAEGFYRYRFSLHLHGTRSYAAQALAAAIDFGPFSALASENGINDLRLQAYNGAAQLYETHLLEYPQSKLAPLSAWRLGWALRATSIDGFPRTSEEVLATLSADPRYGPLSKEALTVPWKSQETAVMLSIVPGAGQMYCGELLNGSIRLVTALGALAAFVLPLVASARSGDLSTTRIAVSTAGFIALQVAYTTAYQDAQRAALEFDERREAEFDAAHPTAP